MTEHEAKQDEQNEDTMSTKIHPLNLLNVGAYMANVVIVALIGNGTGDLPSNGEQSEKYQTIVTPAGWAFSIWGLIFAFQAIFSVVQLLPRFRRSAIVLDGVNYWYILVCLFQIGWTFVFAYDIIWASLLFMILIWIALVRLVTSEYYTNDRENDKKLLQFWLFKFPFELHCGWITAAMAVNVNLVVVSEKAPASVQLTFAIVSLAILHAVAVFVLFAPEKPNYTIPAVLSWASGAIAAELTAPKSLVEATFSEEVIMAVKNASAVVSIVILILIAVRLIATIITVTKNGRNTDDRTGSGKVSAIAQNEGIS